MNPEDDPLEQLKALKAKGQAPDPLDALKKIAQPTAPRLPTKLELAKRNASTPHPEDLEDDEPSYAQKALGGVASLAHDIPGAEAAQAGARSLVRGQSYTEALSDIKGAEAAAPSGVRLYNNAAGATIAALAGPKGTYLNPMGTGGSAAIQGARLGAATGLLSAEPASVEDRLVKAGKGGAVGGAVAGALGDVAPNLLRVISAKSLGANAMARGAEMSAADQAAYGKALAQGKGATHPDVTAALNSPGIAPYAKAARNSESLQGSDDATILHEVYKRLGERQRGLAAQVERAADYKAGPAREIQDIGLAKQRLLDAADKIMPDYRTAVEQHADLAGKYGAFQDAGDATNRLLRGVSPAGRNLQTNTPEAFTARIASMDPEKAAAAREAVLGRVQDKAGDALNKNPLKLFGVPKAVGMVNKVAPVLDLIDRQAKGPNAGAIRKAIMAAVGTHIGND